ncbi:MAG: T9SS type A sorting domain-containing protein [Flavobacteriales bacterium]|nr:T9SS type A sorting domain-containing protein [Flavobacteriales bacterium]
MNRTLTLLALGVSLIPALSAQVTLDQNLIWPGGISLIAYQVTDTGTATLPSDGINQTWDYSSLTLVPVGLVEFTPSSNTPFAAQYPQANWAMAPTTNQDILYLDIDNSGVQMVAYGVPNDVNQYSDLRKVLTFPMAFGQDFTDVFSDNNGTHTVTWTYSGHGTAITPVGTFTDMAKLVSSENDVTLWHTSPLYPFVFADNGDGLVFVPANMSIGETDTPAPLQVFPNPCEEQLNVLASGAWQVFDASGRAVATGSSFQPAPAQLDVTDLAPGAYLLEMRDREGRVRQARFLKD